MSNLVLPTLADVRNCSKKADKAYLLDEAAKKGNAELLNIIFDDDVRFFVATKKLQIPDTFPLIIEDNLDEQLLGLLNLLASGEVRGNEGIILAQNFLDKLNPDEGQNFVNILENKLRLGIGATDVNKLCRHLKIEQYLVMYALRYDKAKPNWKRRWCIQPKIDGMRTIGERNIETDFKTRKGKPLTSLKKFEEEFKKVNPTFSFVSDGEMESGTLEETVCIRRKKEQATEATYTLFGIYPYHEWQTKNFTQPYETVYELTKHFLETHNFNDIRLIPSYNITASSEEEFHNLVQKYTQEFLDQGYEGSVLKSLDHIYDPSSGTRRSGEWIKIKPEIDSDGIIVDVLEGEGEHQGLVGKFNVRWANNVVFEVAPGKLKHTFRKKIWENRNNYIGKKLEFVYQLLSIYGVPRHSYATKLKED